MIGFCGITESVNRPFIPWCIGTDCYNLCNWKSTWWHSEGNIFIICGFIDISHDIIQQRFSIEGIVDTTVIHFVNQRSTLYIGLWKLVTFIHIQKYYKLHFLTLKIFPWNQNKPLVVQFYKSFHALILFLELSM